MISAFEYEKILDMGEDLYFNYCNFDEITGEHAYHIAYHHNNNRNIYPYYDELALIVANNGDTMFHLSWVQDIKTHKNIIFNSFLNNCTVAQAVEWYLTIDNNSHNNQLKEKIIMNNQVNDFIHHMCMSLRKEYTTNDFYKGLSIEHRLGVII